MESGPPLPARNVDRQAWEEANRAMKELEQGGPEDVAAQYGTPDLGDDRHPDRDWLDFGY